MDALNYHHLMYFWVVAREGTIARACERLHLAQPTISTQLRSLERSLGEKLFHRSGRNLVLTEAGQVVFHYADQIFSLGRELISAVRGILTDRPRRLVVGVCLVVPKLIVYRLLEPALQLPESVYVVCQERDLSVLLTDLAMHRLDVVLSDAPAGSTANVRAFNHLLGECGVTIFGTAELASRLRRGFPRSLQEAPLLLPTQNTTLHRNLTQWLEEQQLRPLIRGEYEDSAMMKAFGQAGFGLFPGPTAIEKEICRQYGVRIVGRVPAVRERFFAITVERKLKHPAVVAISEAAREKLFGTSREGEDT